MQQRDGYSLLGFGCMRLPRNYELSKSLIKRAVEGGINYFDTALAYPGNEALLGRILSELGCRNRVMIATKIQPFLIGALDDLEKRFQSQLAHLQTDYIDKYLVHMLPDLAVWKRLVAKGLKEWIVEKKANGQIRGIGFSFHGKTETFLELLDAYSWDFCQVQYNYLDEHTQAGRRGVQEAHKKGISVIVMEPLQGGNLTEGLPPQAKEYFAATGASPARWGLCWLYAQPEVCCVLSGMKTMEMLEENLSNAESESAFSEADEAVIEHVRRIIRSSNKIGCTGCAYCMPCPHGVDIPASFSSYNLSYTERFLSAFSKYLMATTLKANRSNAGRCIACGFCEDKCPQSLSIRKELRKVQERFETPLYAVATLFTQRVYKG